MRSWRHLAKNTRPRRRDHAAVEARVTEWVAVAALLADGDLPSADAALPPVKRHKGLQGDHVQHACAKGMAVLATTVRPCGAHNQGEKRSLS